MEQHLLAYFIGITLVFFSHAYMLYAPNQQMFSMQQHSYTNLLAALLIAYYFMFKENYISF